MYQNAHSKPREESVFVRPNSLLDGDNSSKWRVMEQLCWRAPSNIQWPSALAKRTCSKIHGVVQTTGMHLIRPVIYVQPFIASAMKTDEI